MSKLVLSSLLESLLENMGFIQDSTEINGFGVQDDVYKLKEGLDRGDFDCLVEWEADKLTPNNPRTVLALNEGAWTLGFYSQKHWRSAHDSAEFLTGVSIWRELPGIKGETKTYRGVIAKNND